MANEQTRNLAPYAFTRTTMKLIKLIYSDKTFKDDGSFETVEQEVETKVRLIALTSSEIQRLFESGVTISNGVSISLVGELTRLPDYLKDGEQLYRVVSYTFEQGASVMTCSMLSGKES